MSDDVEFLTSWPPPVKTHSQVTPECEYENGPPPTKLLKKEVTKLDQHSKLPQKKILRKREVEVLGKIRLSKWWRSIGNTICHNTIPASSNPDTCLYLISRQAEGEKFLHDEIGRLHRRLEDSGCSPDVHAALGSLYQLLGDVYPAYKHLQKAVDGGMQDRDIAVLVEQLKKQIHIQQRKDHTYTYQNELTLGTLKSPSKVAIKSATDFSFQDFLFNFALTGTPVIITGLEKNITSLPWNFQHVKQVAGGCQVRVKKPVAHSVQWARLEDDVTMTVSDFIDSLASQARLPPHEQSYLFDWSIPLNCPLLAEELTIPKYFAGDFLQRTQPGSLYRDSWPSLFIAPQGICSDLHIDAFGSNFWMALFEGRKKWTFFPKEDTHLLYPSYCYSLDAVFECDLSKPDFQKFPLLQNAQARECILEPGQILFVPAGCPHRVENLESSLAISSNYVDLSNLSIVMEELRINQVVDDRARDLYEQLSDPVFCRKMKSNIEHLSMKNFKQNTFDYSKYDY